MTYIVEEHYHHNNNIWFYYRLHLHNFVLVNFEIHSLNNNFNPRVMLLFREVTLKQYNVLPL